MPTRDIMATPPRGAAGPRTGWATPGAWKSESIKQGDRCPKPTSDISRHFDAVGTTRGVVGNRARTGVSGRGPSPRVSKARKPTPDFEASYMQVRGTKRVESVLSSLSL